MARAYLLRGILQEHGIPAFVWNEFGSAYYGEDVWGGCLLMVEADQFDDAQEILGAIPGPLPDDVTFSSDSAPLAGSLPGIGLMVCLGAMMGPLLPFVCGFMAQILRILASTPKQRLERFLPTPEEIVLPLLTISFLGALGGLLAGISFLPLGAYKRNQLWGHIFVRCVAILLII